MQAADARPVRALGLHTLASRIVVYASGFASSILIARGLGAVDRGLYALPIAMVTIAGALASQGLDLAQVRLWARGVARRAELAAAAGWLALAAGVGVAGLTWIVYEIGRDGPFEQLAAADLVLVVALLPMWVHSVLVRGLLLMAGSITTVNRALVVGDLCRTAGVIALYALDALSVRSVLALFGLTILVPWALALRAGRSLPRPPDRRPPRTLMREVAGLGVQLSPHFLFLTLLMRVDVLLLAHYRPLEDVGTYAVAVLIAELVWLPTWALAQAVRERQANAPTDEAVAVTVRTVRMTLTIATASGAALALAAPLLTVAVFGDEFTDAPTAVWPLLPAVAALAAWRPMSVILVRLAPAWVAGAISLGALLANVGANVLLIPSLGIVGAGLASTLGYGCGALVAAAVLARAGCIGLSELAPGRREIRDLAAVLNPRFVRRQLAWLRSERPPLR